MRKRIISLLLAVAMVTALIPQISISAKANSTQRDVINVNHISGDAIVAQARTYLGIPYDTSGGNYRDRTGFGDTMMFDCSGFVYRVCRDVGLASSAPNEVYVPEGQDAYGNYYITAHTWYQRYYGQDISDAVRKYVSSGDYSDLQPGDLLFITNDNSSVTHVAIYSGDGTIIHSEGYAGCVSEHPINRYHPNNNSSNWYFDGCRLVDDTSAVVKKVYPSYCSIKITAKTYVKSLPCSRDTNPDSEDVEDGAAKIGSEYQAIGLVENTAGNFWYKVLTKDGETGYIYSGDVTVVSHDFGEVTISGVTAPASIVEGDKFSIHGLVSSNNLPLWQVGAYVYSGSSPNIKLHLKSEDISVDKDSYELYNSAVDYGLTFNQLKEGTYTYEIAVVLFSYTANGKTLNSPDNKAFYLYRDSFSVTKNPANCSHSYNDVGACTDCGTAYDFSASLDTSCAGLYKVIQGSDIRLRTDVPYAASSAKSDPIPAGTTVQVLGSVTNHFQKTWYKVSYNGTVGYVYFEYLSKDEHDCDKNKFVRYEAAHPHHSCYECSICGKTWVDTASSNYDTTCAECTGGSAYETAWFPAPQMYLTQIAYESYSHGVQNAIDIAPGGDVFAPFTGKVVYKDANWGYVVFQSLDKVYYADGTLNYMTIALMHDENIDDLYVGQIINQGTAFYQAGGMGGGNPNAYGDHVHLSVLSGHASGITSAGKYGYGDVYAYNALYVNTNKTTHIINQGVMVAGNHMNNGAPSNWSGLWKGLQNTRPGKPVLNYEVINNKVTFTWSETANTTHYNIWLDKKNAAGEWESVVQMFKAENGVTRELGDGEYRAQLLAYNSNAYEPDGSDWVHTWAEDVIFTINAEKEITYYDANGNVWQEEYFTGGIDHLLVKQYPTSSNGYFSGWAYTPNAKEWAVRPGEIINASEDVTLYPVYVSHAEAISGKAVQIYNIADFNQTGYSIEEVEVTVQQTQSTGSWTDWSDYTTDPISASDKVQVETATLYRYYYFYCSNCGGREPFWGTSDCGAQIPETAWRIGWFTTPFSQCNYRTYSYTSAKYYTTSLGDGQIWNFSSGNLYDTAVGTKDNGVGDVVIQTGYRSRTYVEQTETVEKTVTAYKITAESVKQYDLISYPHKTNYWVGEGLDLTGLMLKVTYADGSTDMITSGFVVSGFDTNTVGTKSIDITYGECSFAHTIIVTYGGQCGENVWWNLDADGTLKVYGSGDMPEIYYNETPWASCRSDIKRLVVQKGVTSIGGCAFQECENLTEVTIANSVTRIGLGAFSDCVNLSGITIPDSVTYLGDSAFHGCTSLTSVTVPSSVMEIGHSAFFGCSSLVSVTLPEGITAINDMMFSECINLTYVNIPTTVKYIGGFAFIRCASLTSITIPSNVTWIACGAFQNCTGLTRVTISDGVKQIDEQAFRFCTGLKEVNIPASVTRLGYEMFCGCDNLESVIYCGNQAQWDAIEKYYKPYSEEDFLDGITLKFHNYQNGACIICQACDTVLTFALNEEGNGYVVSDCDSTASGVIAIPEIFTELPVTGIGYTAFYGCTGLTGIVIPSSVTTIDWGAFQDCSNLTDITIPDSVTYIGVGAFSRCTSLADITLPNNLTVLNDSLFSDCIGLTSISIPDKVTTIGKSAFSGCTNLTNVVLGNGVEIIRYSAFEGCKNLKSITIPASAVVIEDDAFNGCNSLSSVVYCGTQKQWKAISVASGNGLLSKAKLQFHNYKNGICSICLTRENSESSCAHNWSVATCTEAAKCKLCGEVKGSALGHNMQQTAAAIAATCETAGKTAVLTCANGCGKTQGGETVPAKGHSFAGDTCTVCGQGKFVVGDANGDGKVNLKDAILALQAANGKDAAVDRGAADVNGDGKVNLKDAILILKRANGNKDPFPAEK